MPPLMNPRHENFARLCFERPDATDGQNYLDAGYTCCKESARKNATTLRHRKTTQDRIQEFQAEVASDSIMTVKEIEERLSAIGRSAMEDYGECGLDGVHFNIGPEQMKSQALRKVKTKTTYDENGNQVFATVVADVELCDPMKAMDMLLKRRGAYPAIRMEHTGRDGRELPAAQVLVLVSSEAAKELTNRITGGEGTELCNQLQLQAGKVGDRVGDSATR